MRYWPHVSEINVDNVCSNGDIIMIIRIIQIIALTSANRKDETLKQQ